MNEETTPFAKEIKIYQDNLSTVYRMAYTFLGNKRAAMAVTRYTFQTMIQEGIEFTNKAQERDWLARKAAEASIATMNTGIAIGSDGLGDDIVNAFVALPADLKAAAYLFYAEGCTAKKLGDILGGTTEEMTQLLDAARIYLSPVTGGVNRA